MGKEKKVNKGCINQQHLEHLNSIPQLQLLAQNRLFKQTLPTQMTLQLKNPPNTRAAAAVLDTSIIYLIQSINQ